MEWAKLTNPDEIKALGAEWNIWRWSWLGQLENRQSHVYQMLFSFSQRSPKSRMTRNGSPPDRVHKIQHRGGNKVSSVVDSSKVVRKLSWQ